MKRAFLKIFAFSSHEKNEHVSLWWVLPILVSIVALLASTRVALFSTPKVVPTGNALAFSGERAYEHVSYLAHSIGPRFTGTTNNENYTIRYLVDQISAVQRASFLDLEVEVQQGSGSFVEEWQKFRSVNVYRGVQNVIARLVPRNGTSSRNILLNSHFDSVAYSPGAGDDGSMVAVMLELLRVLAQTPLSHPIIFLFNGCEENSLQGAHSFISNHRLKDDIFLLINLDVAGTGGREILFQTTEGDSWLIKKYVKAVRRPFANVLAEELYQAGVIPSDTDFSMFQKYSSRKIPAFDFAHILNGYAYHTIYDDASKVEKGSLQVTGDNVLALLKEIDGSREIDGGEENGSQWIFFDFFGTGMVLLSLNVLLITNWTVAVLVVGLILWMMRSIAVRQDVKLTQVLLKLLIAVGLQVASIIVGLLLVALLGFLFKLMGKSMFWFTSVWAVFGIYACPFLFCLTAIPLSYIRQHESKALSCSYLVQLQTMGFSLILLVILVTLSALQIRSSYIFLIPLLFYLVSSVFSTSLGFIHSKKWAIVHLALQVLPISLYFYLMSLTFSVIIPTLGRNYEGSTTNPEYTVAAITSLFCLLTTGFIAPIVLMFKRRVILVSAFLVGFVVFFILLWTPVCFPFRDNKVPQRFQVLHFEAEFFNHDLTLRKADVGYFLFTYDALKFSLVEDSIKHEFRASEDTKRRCAVEVLCGIPIYHIYFAPGVVESRWIPSLDRPQAPQKPSLVLKSTEEEGNSLKFTFVMRGPTHMSLQISPTDQYRLSRWSFLDDEVVTDKLSMDLFGRQVFFVNYVHGHPQYSFQDFEFWLELERKTNESLGYAFDIAFSSHFVEHEHSEGLRRLVDEFPRWTSVQFMTSFYASYEF